jgi:HAD superfamily hydrolase (TIGR01509 family)
MSIDSVIFDVDGTLVDSNDAHARAWVDAFEEAGLPSDFASVRRLIGVGGDKLLPQVTGLGPDSERGKRILERRAAIFRDRYVSGLRPFPGTRELFQTLASDGFRLGIASSARKDELARLLDIAGVSDLVEQKTSASDVESSKPDPDVVHAALARLGVAPGQALMVGDTPYDGEAAHRGGVGFIAFRSGGWMDAELAGALAIFEGPADMLNARPWRSWAQGIHLQDAGAPG